MTKLFFCTFLLLFSIKGFATLGPGVSTYHGRIIQPNSLPLESSSVDFTLQIISPGAEACVLYEESHNRNMSSSEGLFSLNVGQGIVSLSDPGIGLSTSMSNNTVFNVGTYPALNCAIGTSYTPAPGDTRKFRVAFNYSGSGGAVTISPDITINSVPYTMYASKLEGLGKDDMLQVRSGGSYVLNQANIEAAFTSTNYPLLINAIDGTHSAYAKSTDLPISGGVLNLSGGGVRVQDTPATGDAAVNRNYSDANVGGRGLDFSAVGPAAGDGRTIIWDQTNNRWVTGTPTATDNTKLPLAGGTMTGAINMGGENLLATGHITMSPQTTINLGTYTTAQETTLVGTLGGVDEGKTWYNSTTDQMMIWNGSAAVTTGNDASKLPLAGGTMTGAINMGGENLLATGHITMSSETTINLGTYTAAQQTTLVGTLGGIDEGKTWYNSTTDKMMVWDGVGAVVVGDGDITAVNTNSGSGLSGGATSGAATLQVVVDDSTVEIATNTIQVKDSGITSAKIANGTIALADMGSNSVNSANIVADSIVAADIATGGVTTTEILDGTVALADMAADSVDSSKIVNGSIALADMGSNSVNSANIVADSIVAADIATGGVATAEILDGTILTVDIADSNVTNAKIATVGVEKVVSGVGNYFTYAPNNAVCTNNQVLKWVTANLRWECANDTDTTDHGTLAGLGDDDHTQYLLLAGRAGGQSALGGTASGDDLTLESTSDATKGDIILNPNGGNVGVGIAAPLYLIDASSTGFSQMQLHRDIATNGSGIHFDFSFDNSTAAKTVYSRIVSTIANNTNGAESGDIAFRNIHAGTISDIMVVRGNGRVGIGDTSPETRLDVEGTIKIADDGETCTVAGDAGMITYNGGNLEFCDGSAWQTISAGAGVGDITAVNTNSGSGLSGGATSGAATLQVVVDDSTVEIATNTIRVKDDGITSAKIANGTIALADMGANSVNSANIVADSIVAADIATGGVATAEILDGTILTADIADSNITNAKIATVGVEKVVSGVGNYFTYAPNNAACSNNEVLKWSTANTRWECGADAGATDHGALAGLGDDDHTQYLLLAGRSGGQSAYGGTASGDDLTIESTSDATKGDIILNPTTGNVGIGDATPETRLDVAGTIKIADDGETCTVAGDAGMITYNSGNLEFCDGSAWIELAASAGTGDITAVNTNSGSGLSGGVSTGAATLQVVVDDSTVEIATNTIRVKDDGITSAKIAADTIVAADIATGGVATAEILDGTILTADIADSNVTNAKIATVGVEKVVSGVGNYFTYAPNNAVCTNNQVLKWVTANLRWECANDTDTTDHGTLAGLGDDDHTQYLLLAGRAGGQSALGGTASGDDLTIESTSDATKGDIILNPTTGNVGIGDATPETRLDVAGTIKIADDGETCTVAGDAGMITYNGGNLEFCDGSAWQTISAGAGVGDITAVNTNSGSGLSGGATSGAATLQVVVDDSTVEIATNTIRVKDDGITSAKIANGTIALADMGSNSVNSANIVADSIVAADIATGGVATAEILDGTILTADIADSNITNAKIATVGVEKVVSGVGNYFTYAPNNAACSNNEVLKWSTANTRWECGADAGATDHGALAGLGDDDHTQYLLLAGRAGGQSAFGGTASGDDLTLESTSDATKGDIILNPTTGSVGIGDPTPATKLEVAGTIKIGDGGETCGAGFVGSVRYSSSTIQYCNGTTWLTLADTTGAASEIDDLSDANSDYARNSLYLGLSAGGSITSGVNNVAVGESALPATTIGSRNIAVGYWTLYSSTNSLNDNVAVGDSALYSAVGGNNVAVGTSALFDNSGGAGASNTAVGYQAGYQAGGANNTFLGQQAGHHATASSGSNNIAIGYQAGDNLTSGSTNITIGASVDAVSATADNQLNIGNTIYGNLSNDRVGIGVPAPETSLEIAGTLMLADGGETCSATYAGGLRYNSSTMQFCNGTSWLTISSTGAGDNLGNHTATTNIQLGTNYLSGDGGNEGVFVGATGFVGVGTEGSPDTFLHVDGNIASGSYESTVVIEGTHTDGGSTQYGMHVKNHVQPAAASTREYSGIYVQTNSPSSANMAGADLTGLVSAPEYSGTTAGGDIIGLRVYPRLLNTSTAGNSYGIRIEDPYVASGSITTNYGLFIEPMTAGTTDYTIYTLSTADSVLNGRIGVKDATPDAYLEVTSDGGSGVDLFKLSSNDFGVDGDFVVVKDDGKVGIGDETPATRLDVGGSIRFGDGGETCGATFAGAMRYNSSTMQFCNGTSWLTMGSTGAGDNLGNHTATTNIQLGSNYLSGDGGSEGILIDASGNVGIGGSADGTKVLSVTGGTNMQSSGALPLNIFRQDTSDDTQTLLTFTRDRSDGTAPGSGFAGDINFELEGFTNGTLPTAANLVWGWENAQTDDTTDRDSYMAFGTMQNNTLSEAMRINSAGEVGIGIDDPDYPLHVAGRLGISSSDGNGAGWITTSGEATTANKLLINASRGNGGIIFEVTSTEYARFNNNGNFGHGDTTPDASIEISANGVTTGDALMVSSDDGNDGDLFIVQENGLVGIGDATPVTRLDVGGSVRIGDGGETCGATFAGAMRYNTATIQFCNGTTWLTVADTLSAGATELDDLSDAKTVDARDSLYIGQGSGGAVTSADNNVAIGDLAMISTTTGDRNIAIGYHTMYTAGVGQSDNIAIGDQALYGSGGDDNVAVGSSALFNNVGGVGAENTAVGYRAGYQIGGANGTFLGAYSGFNSGGNDLVAIGNGALYKSSVSSAGVGSIAVGYESSYGSEGAGNVVIGRRAYFNNIGSSTGANNVVVGTEAAGSAVAKSGDDNVSLGYRAHQGLTSGSNNIAIGATSGDSITSGDYNITIGHNADVVSATSDNQLNIGGTIYGDMSAKDVGIDETNPADKLDVNGDIRVGTGTTGCVKDSDGTTIAGTCSSDRRFKKNIKSLPSLADQLAKLRPTTYNWREDEFPEKRFSGEEQIGLIAQEVEEIFPEMVAIDEQGYYQVRYSDLNMYVLQATIEQQKSIGENKLYCEVNFESLRKDVKKLQNESEESQVELKSLKEKLANADQENKLQDRRISSLQQENIQLKKRLDAIEKLIQDKLK